MSASSNIKRNYEKLTAAEKRIADFVLENKSDAINVSVSVLAEAANTAPSAVIRFCKSSGFEGFRSFKLELAKESGSLEAVNSLPDVINEHTVSGVFDRVFMNAEKALADTRALLETEDINTAVDAIKNAKRIFLFGLGTSSHVISDVQYRFMQLGKTVVATSDVLNMMVQAANTVEGDLVIVVSHSGRTREVLSALKLSKKSGADTLAVTSYAESPMAKAADMVISVYSDEENSPVEAVAARLAHICVFDAIAASLMIADKKNAELHLGKRDAVLDEIREAL